MRPQIRAYTAVVAALACALALAGVMRLARAADHADGNGVFGDWDLAGRRDANITNFFAFRAPAVDSDKLVLVLLMNAGITDPGYFFAEDLTLRFHIDTDSRVTFNGDPSSTTDDWMMRFGGTVTDVDKISDNIVFEVTFAATPDGRTAPHLRIEGLPASAAQDIRMFPESTESPVRGGTAVLALQVPLTLLGRNLDSDRALLLWATSKIPELNGPISDHMGMPNTSNQPANLSINRLRPREQSAFIIKRPPDLVDLPGNPVSLARYADVLIYNVSQPARGFPVPQPPPPPFNPFDPAGFPNGRPLPAALRATPFVFPYVAQ